MNEDEVIGHWGFAADTEHSWVTGELLLRADGTLLRRYGGDSYADGQTTWNFREWQPVSKWPGYTDIEQATTALIGQGYELSQPSPVPIDANTAGPFDGMAGGAKYI